MADVILELTDDGYSQLLKNAGYEGFNLEITKVEPINGNTKLGSYAATGISRKNDEIVIKSVITSTKEHQSFNFDKLNLIDKSGIIFAVVRNSDNSVLDGVTPFKKATVNLKLRYDLSKNNLIVIQDLSAENISIIVHSLDDSAHDVLFSKYVTKKDIGQYPANPKDVGKALKASFAASFYERMESAYKSLKSLKRKSEQINTMVWDDRKPCLYSEINHGNGLRQKIITLPSFSLADESYAKLDTFGSNRTDYQGVVIRLDIPFPFENLISVKAILHPPMTMSQMPQVETYLAYADYSEWVATVDARRCSNSQIFTQFRRWGGTDNELLGVTFFVEGF